MENCCGLLVHSRFHRKLSSGTLLFQSFTLDISQGQANKYISTGFSESFAHFRGGEGGGKVDGGGKGGKGGSKGKGGGLGGKGGGREKGGVGGAKGVAGGAKGVGGTKDGGRGVGKGGGGAGGKKKGKKKDDLSMLDGF